LGERKEEDIREIRAKGGKRDQEAVDRETMV